MMVEDNDDDRDNATGDDDDEDDYRDNDDDKVSFTPPCHKSKMTEAGVQRLIHGAGQILKHFTFYTHQIIADGLFGLRLSEIALKIIVDELPAENKHYSPLKKLYDDIKKLNNQVYNNVRQKENKYDIQFDKILRPLPKEFLRFPQLSLKDMRHFYEKGNFVVCYMFFFSFCTLKIFKDFCFYSVCILQNKIPSTGKQGIQRINI